jgi:cellulose synthase/poly-beta-1,6-N-acetylglucosamine synthase-like glycosyltransferase
MLTVAEIVFWFAVLILCYIYVGYPALLCVLAQLFRKRRADADFCPSITVLIAAYNEEASIKRKLEETLALDYPPGKVEVLVVSDGSDDATDAIVRAFPDPRVRFLRVEGRRGKTHAQNEGVKLCSGDVVVFSDATAVYHRQALRRLAANYSDQRIGAVSGRYHYFDPNESSPTGLGSVAFWNFENLIKRFQSQISTLTGCSGCIYSVRKSAYTALPDEACSDLVQPLHVVQKGYRVAFEERALAYETTTTSTTDEFRMRVRVAGRGIRGILSVPELLKFWRHGWISFQLFSHKILRWQMPILLLLLFLSNAVLIGKPPYQYVFVLQAFFYAVAGLQVMIPFHRYWKPLGLPLYFCTLNAAVLVSIYQLLRGNRYVVWQTVRR